MTEEEEKMTEAGRRLRSGGSYNKTARDLGIGVTKLRNRFPGMGYKDGQRKPQPTEEQLAWAADLYADGQSRKEVHRTTGISIFFLTKYFPNDKWTPQEAGAHAVLLAKERRISDRIQK